MRSDCTARDRQTEQTMPTLPSKAEARRLAELVRQLAGTQSVAKANAANRLISNCLIFIEHLYPDPAQKELAAQWFRKRVKNTPKNDLYMAMTYAYSSYAGGKRTQGGTRTKRVRSLSEVRVPQASVHLELCELCNRTKPRRTRLMLA